MSSAFARKKGATAMVGLTQSVTTEAFFEKTERKVNKEKVFSALRSSRIVRSIAEVPIKTLAASLICAVALTAQATDRDIFLSSNGQAAAHVSQQTKGQPNAEVKKPEKELHATPDKEVAADKVFVKPKEPEKPKLKTARDIDAETHKYLMPSLSFMSYFDPWKLPVGDVTLLQDTVQTLIRKHSDCRIVPSYWKESTGRAACSNPSRFLAEGEEVIFTYSPVNEILTGAVYTFASNSRAKQFVRSVIDVLQSRMPTFRDALAAKDGSDVLDSPMFSVSVQPSQKRWIVVIEAHHQDRYADAEAYAKARLQTMEFGDLTIGKSKISELPDDYDLPKTCTNVTGNFDEAVREYYGVCFGFPYEAHMQFNYSETTGILQTVVLSPIGVTTGSIVDNMLVKKYGEAQYCRKTQSHAVLNKIKFTPNRGKPKQKSMFGKPASVYAGSCDNPIIFTSEMRYVFENRFLNKAEIDADYQRRKAVADTAEDSISEYAARVDKMKNFFE